MTKRQILVTPEVERFFQICSSTPLASDLYRDMQRVSSRQKGSDGFIRLSVPPFLSYTKGDVSVYWHGPTDGAFFKDKILERASPFTLNLLEF